jgi:NAD(P)-dependent dehydrogenase (short-subunit alcohol dehydrogenase family)
MKIVVIDGQGGRMGKAIIEALMARKGEHVPYVVAIGTNSIATKAMLSAGADGGATGENALIVNVRDADCVIGPIGILVADALLGEVSPMMAVAVGQSPAKKIVLPVNRCNTCVMGGRGASMAELLDEVVREVFS